jgi:hypothetical protein
LHRADLLQALGRNGELAELIKKELSRFPDYVSKRILRSYRHPQP